MSLTWTLLLILVFSNILRRVATTNENLAVRLLSNLDRLGKFDTFLVFDDGDKERQRILTAQAFYSSIPVTVLTANGTKDAFPVFDCNSAEEKGQYRLSRRSRLFFSTITGVSGIETFLASLDSTILNCPDLVEAGYYHHGNVFAFYSDSATDTKLLQTAVLDNNSNMQEHVHVGFFAQTSDKQRLAFGTYDMFLARFEANSVWYAGESEFESLRAMFALRKMQKFKLIGSALPYDIMVQADYIPGQDPTGLFSNHRGFEITQLKEICKSWDCTYEIRNPPDFQWGTVDGGRATGHFREIAQGRVHFALGAIIGYYGRNKVATMGCSGDYEAVLTLAAPNPKLFRSVFSLLQPLTPTVWALCFCFLLVATLALSSVSRLEERLAARIDLRHFSSPSQALWFGFACSVGESVNRGRNSDGAWAVRCICASWLTFSFVVASGYGGNLRAFIMTPASEEPMGSVADLLESGLPWNMVLYGEKAEQDMAESKDPKLKELWLNKEVVEYAEFPYERVKDVYEGKSVTVEWSPLLRSCVATAFTLPNGEELVHVPGSLGLHQPYTVPGTWFFHPLNAWLFLRAEGEALKHAESGIRRHWIQEAKQAHKARFRGLLNSQGELTPAQEFVLSSRRRNDFGVAATSPSDLAGIFSTAGAMLAVATGRLFCELALARRVRKRRSRETRSWL